MQKDNSLITKSEAIKYLGLDEKLFDNYFKNASEFTSIPRTGNKGKFYFDKNVLEKWLQDYHWRSIELTIEDYCQCLDFALAQHFRGYVLSDWGTARQREFGQKITNWVKGQLAEVAVKKFLKREFNIDIELDFEIHETIVPQDIIGIKENETYRKPKIGVGIKSSKPKSSYLILGENEVIIPERRSDYYIFCRPDIPDDHLLRITKDSVKDLVKNQQHFSSYSEKIPGFENMFCEIAGWCRLDELDKVRGIEGQEFDNGFRYVRKSGMLHKDISGWKELVSKL